MEIYGIITLRVLLLYVLIVGIFRVMGKREIGELGINDSAVFVMIAEIAILAVEKPKDSLFPSIYPMLLLTILHVGFSFISLKSRIFRKIVDGEPSIIIRNGNILEKEMRRQRYNLDDLLMQLRQKDVRDIAEVEYAILEPTGKLSVIKKEANTSGYIVALIMDGKVQKDKLKAVNKTEAWLKDNLQKQGIDDISKVSLCTYRDGDMYIDLID